MVVLLDRKVQRETKLQKEELLGEDSICFDSITDTVNYPVRKMLFSSGLR